MPGASGWDAVGGGEPAWSALGGGEPTWAAREGGEPVWAAVGGGVAPAGPAAAFTTYYVSAAGSDAANGTSTGTPWLTVAKANTAAPAAGDSILFRRGDRWRETLNLPASGNTGTPITFGAYSTGANPILDGSNLLASWTLDSGSIYYNSAPGFDGAINEPQVFQDDVRLIYKATKAAMVAGSTFWDSAAGRLYVWATDSANPTTHTIEVSARYTALSFNGRSNVVIDGIEITKARGPNVTNQALNCHDVTMKNCVSSKAFSRGYLLNLASSPTYNIAFVDCIARDCIGEGFWIGYGSNNGCLRCEIYDICIDAVAKGYSVSGRGSGILVAGSTINNYVKDCYIHDIYQKYPLMVEHESGEVKPVGAIITGNRIYNNRGAGDIYDVVMCQGDSTLFAYNVVTTTQINCNLLALDTQGAGGSLNESFYHNVFYVAAGVAAYRAIHLRNSSGATFKNNIVAFGAGADSLHFVYETPNNSGFVSDYNRLPDNRGYWAPTTNTTTTLAAWRTASGQDAHSINTDPLFANAAANNFRLTSSSPAKDAGVAVSGIGQIVVGAAPDMGAVEFGATPFVPSDIAGLKVWIKADAGTFQDTARTVLAAADADPVGGLADQSGVGNHFSQATAGYRPLLKTAILNGKPILRFDGTDDRLVTASADYSAFVGPAAGTIFVVQRQVGTQVNNTTVTWESVSSNRFAATATVADVLYFDLPNQTAGDGRVSVAQPAGWDDSWRVLRFRRSASVKQIYSNTTQLVTGTPGAGVFSSSSQPLVLGAASPSGSTPLRGDIAELLIYDTGLSDADCASVESYLNGRWAVY